MESNFATRIKQAIKEVPLRSDDDLIFLQKCCTSHVQAKELKAYKSAIERERKRRGRVNLVADVTPLDEQVAEAEAQEAYLKGESS